ncbi:MAG: DUF1294 domain-containing protein [Firmicutes bacterium HGW-Firmicutes-15]|nr:MAG: DUF1294 domain-containing protein [Firmicutes bacterium HGW-Firmicutes-15]
MEISLYYLVIINLITCGAFAWDKRLARRGARRIAEGTLLLYSFLGGSVGGLLGMYVFHHKTRHFKFKWGLPLILLLQAGLLFIIIRSR